MCSVALETACICAKRGEWRQALTFADESLLRGWHDMKTRALKAGTAARAYVANDADTFIFQQVIRAAEEAGVPCVRVAEMKELGIVCGVEVPAAAAAVLK